jgi:hypothetical protein
MARVETKLTPTAEGGFTARKRIPADVREEYGPLFGKRKPQWEAWFNSGPMLIGLARAKHRGWLSDIEARIANIRAERKGEGTHTFADAGTGACGRMVHLVDDAQPPTGRICMSSFATAHTMALLL